ncbi:MAG: hypothetical protein K2N23_05210 [Clostridia bacterium]|nr:hypothetical protein [Clostridia bacterium]
MKIKKLGKAIVTLILGATMGMSAFAFTACGDDDDDDNKKNPPITNQHVHSYTYTDNEDGYTHNGVCNAAGDCDAKNIVNESHRFGTDGVCVCGAEKPDPNKHVHNYAYTDNEDGLTHNGVCNAAGECDNKNISNEAHDFGDGDECKKCGAEKDDKPGTDISKATISVSVDKNVINAGTDETIHATAAIEGLPDTSVVWTISGDGVSYVDMNQNGVLSLKANRTPKIDQAVFITATSVVSGQVTDSVVVTIKAPKISGQVGELTTAMFEELGNSAITVTGEVMDIHLDIAGDGKNDASRTYEYTVMMSDGAWYGAWNEKGGKDEAINNYRRSETTATVGGITGYTFDEVFINLHNEVDQKPVTDYNSVPALWQNQHMWNHLAQLCGTNIEDSWEYDALNRVYVYKFDNTSIEDLYLRTYLAYSLTPMLGNSDTLEQIELTVEDVDGVKKIVKMDAVTSAFYGEDVKAEDATFVEYTTLTAYFTNVGTTEVPEPTPYKAPQHVNALSEALAAMKGAKNYTFKAVETTVQAPSIDEGDYSVDSVSTYKTTAANGTSATGQVGLVGQVTEDAILLARTGQYTSTMDGNSYWTQYSGYKQLDENTYDFFEYNGGIGELEGTRQYKGNIFDHMPQFDFSANLFKYDGGVEVNVGSTEEGEEDFVFLYTFTLREPSISRDVAMQISAHSYAADAKGATYGSLKIMVLDAYEDDNGVQHPARIISTQFPYDLISGTYLGVIETTYSAVGTTVIPEGTFDGYVAREIKTEWSQYDVRYYHKDHSTLSGYDEIKADVLLDQIYGEEAANLPKPEAFINVFEDTISGPFFDWQEEDNTATGGGITYKDYISLKISIDEYDENMKINDAIYAKYINALTAELEEYGFSVSAANSGKTYWGDRYTTYVNGNIMIVIGNNGTRFFDVDIMKVGMFRYNQDWNVAPNA